MSVSAVFRSKLLANFNGISSQIKHILCFFYFKKVRFSKVLSKILAKKTSIKKFSNALLSLTKTMKLHHKNFNIFLIILAKFSQILAKIKENVNKNCRIFTKF